jgi:hypothetical protein
VRSVSSRRHAVLFAALVLAGLAACSGGRDAVPAGTATVQNAWHGCRALKHTNDAYELLALGGQGGAPADFRSVTVVRCLVEERQQPDGSVALTHVEQRAAGDLKPLLQALALPSQQPGKSEQVACTADAWLPPWLFLMDSRGRWIYPKIPTNVCAKPRQEFSAAYDALAFTDRATEVLRTVRSAAAVRAGCEQRSTDMVWFASHFEHPTSTPPADPFQGHPLRACSYRSIAAERGQDKAQGEFTSGGPLAAAKAAAVARALRASTWKPTNCTTQAHLVALVWRQDQQGPQLYVELDSCRRALVYGGAEPPIMNGASAELVRLLSG